MSEENVKRPPRRGPGGFSGEKLKKGDFSSSIKNLVISMKKYLGWMLVAIVLFTIGVVFQLISPSVLQDVTNEIYAGQATRTIDLDFVQSKCIMLVVFYLVIVICNYVGGYIMTTITQYYSRDLRKGIASKINVVPLNYFDTHSFGDLLSRLTNDVDQIGQSLQQSLSMIFQSVMQLIGVCKMGMIIC